MASMPRRKKGIVTYSRKKKPHAQPPRLSIELSQNSEASVLPTSHQPLSIISKTRKRITLTSPEPQSRVPSSLDSLPSDVLNDHHGVAEDRPPKSQKLSKKPKLPHSAKPLFRCLPVNELAIVSSADTHSTRPVSPISESDSSENDPISDDNSLARILFPSQAKRRRTFKKQPRPLLSIVRKSLKAPSVPKRNTRGKATYLPPSTLNVEIQKGADSFTGSELFVPPGSKRKRVRKPRVSAVLGTLDVYRGPHPDVQFERVDRVQDDSEVLRTSEQQTNLILEAAGAGDHENLSSRPSGGAMIPREQGATTPPEHPASTHAKGTESSSHYTTNTNTRSSSVSTDNLDTASQHSIEDVQQEQPTSECVEAVEISGNSTNRIYYPSSQAPTNTINESTSRASLKESLIYAQLSSISAPPRRTTSYTTASAAPDEYSDHDYETILLSDPESLQGLSDREAYQSDSTNDQEQEQSQEDNQNVSINKESTHQPQIHQEKQPLSVTHHYNTGLPYISSGLAPSKSWVSETVLQSSPRGKRINKDTDISRFFKPFRRAGRAGVKTSSE